MGLAGLAALGLAAPAPKGSALIIIETDGCFADGIEVSTGASLGQRNLRVVDFGKIAATFVDIQTERVLRLSPEKNVRQQAESYAPDLKTSYYAQLHGYQRMPEKELFDYREVILRPSLKAILSRPGFRLECERCGEEIINERQVVVNGLALCQTCAKQGYYLEFGE